MYLAVRFSSINYIMRDTAGRLFIEGNIARAADANDGSTTFSCILMPRNACFLNACG